MPIIVPRRSLLSVKETASRLGLHEKTVRRKIASGELPAVQLGGPGSALRVPLEDWLLEESTHDGRSSVR